MTRRIRIPFLLDLLIVDRPEEIAALDADPAVGRSFSRSKSRTVRWLGGRLCRLLSIGGTPYPALLPREDRLRAGQTAALERRLEQFPLKRMPVERENLRDSKKLESRSDSIGSGQALSAAAAFPGGTVRELARYVRGEAGEEAVHAPLQELIGRQLLPDYAATEQTVRDALRLGEAARNPLRGLLLWLTGRLGPIRGRLAEAADGDIYAAHGIVVGFQSLLIELRKLRAPLRRKRRRGGEAGRGCRRAADRAAAQDAARCDRRGPRPLPSGPGRAAHADRPRPRRDRP